IKWRGVDRDVTERRRAEEEIRKAHVKLAVAHHEMKIARRIQESLLPSGPLIVPGVRVEGHCLPADQVGGDYFDYFCRGKDTVDVVIADVSGHAVGPALFMVETRSALRTQTQLIAEPGETLFLMNGFLYHDLSQSDHFITMFYLQYHCATRKLSYANAGHNPPLLMRRGAKSCQALDAEGLVLGVKDVVCFDQKEETLEPGDLVFLYTDGLTEAQGPDGEFFGAGRLCRIISENSHLNAEQLMQLCIAELKSFRKTNTFTDDLTMVVLNVTDEVLD
ncbi:MAG: PP2C family protein-serine/threonine phosphatase, partial [Methylococcales bacterium]